jgi:hypothetical protein
MTANCQKETFVPVHTIMHMQADKFVGSPMNPEYFVIMQSDCAAEMEDWVSLQHDLEHVLYALNDLKQLLKDPDDSHTLVRALWTSALVAYCRCFSTGRRIRLDPETVFGPNNPDLEHHRKVTKMRDKHLAHPLKLEESVIVGIHVDEAFVPESVAQIIVFAVSGAEDEVANLVSVTSRLLSYVNEKTQNLKSKLLAEARCLSKDQLSSLPTLADTIRHGEHQDPP